jgi:hypothetical protein
VASTRCAPSAAAYDSWIDITFSLVFRSWCSVAPSPICFGFSVFSGGSRRAFLVFVDIGKVTRFLFWPFASSPSRGPVGFHRARSDKSAGDGRNIQGDLRRSIST